MRIKSAQIENISHYIYPVPNPGIMSGSIVITAVGISEDNRIVRFRVSNVSLTALLDQISDKLANTDQYHIIEEMNYDTWPGESKPKGTVWTA